MEPSISLRPAPIETDCGEEFTVYADITVYNRGNYTLSSTISGTDCEISGGSGGGTCNNIICSETIPLKATIRCSPPNRYSVHLTVTIKDGAGETNSDTISVTINLKI